jgi:hypothetical protein
MYVGEALKGLLAPCLIDVADIYSLFHHTYAIKRVLDQEGR